MEFTNWLNHKILHESGLARVRRILYGDVPTIHSVGIMTAQNPSATALSRDANKELNNQLLTTLRAGNYGPIKVKGKFEGIKENSFLIPNIARSDLVNLGKKFNQESVIWGEKLQDRSGNPYVKFDYIDSDSGNTVSTRSVHVGTQDRDDYYTMAKGRKFIIPFFGDPLAQKVPGEKYGTVVNPNPWDNEKLAKKVEFFVIPFFDEPNAEIELFSEAAITYHADLLADDPYVKQLVEEIHRCEKELRVEGKNRKHYWHLRGILFECMTKLSCL